MKNFLLAALAIMGIVPINAQNENELFDEAVVVYNRQLYGGVQLHSNGFGGFFNLGKYREVRKIAMYGFDLVFMKHEKEVRSWNPYNREARSYIYGKSNNLYLLRPSLGRKKILTEKLRSSGVQVGYIWQIGPTLGFTKPVYLEITHPEGILYDSISVEKFDPLSHFADNILERASSLNGLDEIKLHLGGSFKFALSFEYSNLKDRLKGLETGVSFDVFPNRIPIMSEQVLLEDGDYAKNHFLFFNFYINIFFGRKYNNT